ncbi:MAG TPA: SRPBCC family protein [Planctomycetota bacterium]|nr:SRPBCC family protein [Planctomycetota bacterium]
MKLRLSDLWRWEGDLDRGAYAFWGLLLAGIKYNLDRTLISAATGQAWRHGLYWMPGDTFSALLNEPSLAAARWLLLLTALPFLWAGVVLTLRRLHSAGLPPWLVALFFMPAINVLFFVMLSFLPPRPTGREAVRQAPLGRLIPRNDLGSAAMAMALTALPAGLLVAFATELTRTYGWTLFVGVPFMIGLFSTLLSSYHAPRTLKACIAVTTGSLTLLGLVLVVIAFEGIICIFMAAPLAWGIALAGTILGRFVAKIWRDECQASALALLVALPLVMGAEGTAQGEPPLQAVRTTVEIAATPDRVWRHVVSFTEIPAPGELIFRTGLSYPLRAEIVGRGVGAVRHCVFTTGPFVEPITTWDEPRLLAFGVTAQPAPMEEWTPYPGIHPPHLDGYFVSRRGQFLLTPLPDGKTLLEGTTWYTHRLWPTAYWGLWSDAIIHRIHGRVLRHVKRLAEERGA